MKVCLLFGTALKGHISLNQAEHDNDLHTILASFYLWKFCNGSFLCSCTRCLNTTLMLVTLGIVNGSICKSDLYIWILHVNEETRCLKILSGHFRGDFCGHNRHKQKRRWRRISWLENYASKVLDWELFCQRSALECFNWLHFTVCYPSSTSMIVRFIYS